MRSCEDALPNSCRSFGYFFALLRSGFEGSMLFSQFSFVVLTYICGKVVGRYLELSK